MLLGSEVGIALSIQRRTTEFSHPFGCRHSVVVVAGKLLILHRLNLTIGYSRNMKLYKLGHFLIRNNPDLCSLTRTAWNVELFHPLPLYPCFLH